MNIPNIKNPVRRRLHLLWIVPYFALAIIPFTLWYGLKEFTAMCREIPISIREVWEGRNGW